MKPEKYGLQKTDFEVFVSGCRLSVRRLSHEQSCPDQPVLVFLHEGLGCIEMWRDFPEEIAARTGYDALVYDRPGHGKSGPMPPFMRDSSYIERESWEILPDVLEQCGVKQCILAGHSDGGTMALLFAARFPGQTAAVITEAAHVFVEPLTVQGIRKAVHAFETSDLPEKLARFHGPNLNTVFRRWQTVWLSEEFASWNIEIFLQDIRCPALVIQGADDEYGTLRQVNAIADAVSGSAEALVIPGCAHIPHFQARQTVADAIAEFIRKICGRQML